MTMGQPQSFNRPFETLRAPSKISTWGQALASCRMQRGLSHRDVADRVGVGIPLVRDWEMNLAVPTRAQIKRLMHMCFFQIKHFTYLLPEEMRRPPAINPADPDEAFVPEQATEPPPAELIKPRPDPKNFGESLQRAREEEGLSRAELAEVLEVTPDAIRKWEERDSNPYVHNYEKLLQLFPSIGRVPRPTDMRVSKAASAPRLASIPALAPPPPPPPPPPPTTTPVGQPAPEEAGAAYGRAMAEAKRARTAVAAAEAKLEEAKRAVVESDEAVKRAHARLLENL